jgi:hypothetical protein
MKKANQAGMIDPAIEGERGTFRLFAARPGGSTTAATAAVETDASMSSANDLPASVGGLPAFYYWKDALTSGRYVHPTKRFSLEVTPDRLEALARNFRGMKEAGIAVPILADHAERADAALGFIIDVKIENGWLRELHQFLGPQARDLGLRNGVSLGLAPDYVDGQGRNWGEAIAHSALTPLPVVAGQGPFVAAGPATWTLAMADDADESSAADPPDDAERDDTEDAVPEPPDPANPAAPDGPFVLTPTQMDRLRQLIPDADVLDAATLVDRLLDLLEAANDEAGAGPDEDASAAAVPANLSVADDALARARREMLGLRRDRLVERGALTPAAADALMAALLPSPLTTTGGVIALSHSSHDPSALAGAVLNALEDNRPAPQGEVSGLQALARVPPGDPLGGGDLPFRRMADRFNGRH